jgi:hypothetical protein
LTVGVGRPAPRGPRYTHRNGIILQPVLGLVDGATWAEALTAIGTIVIALGVVFTGMQVRDSRKARSAEIVRQLAEHWATKELIGARRRIASYQGDDSIDKLVLDLKGAKDQPLSKDYFVFTRYLNFWEQVGLEFRGHSGGQRVVDEMFGDLMMAAWHNTWEKVIPRVWEPKAGVGSAFAKMVQKIERKRKWRSRRRRLWRWLSTPYYDTQPPGGEISGAP